MSDIAERHRQEAARYEQQTVRERQDFEAYMATRGFGDEPANYDMSDPSYRARLDAVGDYHRMAPAERMAIVRPAAAAVSVPVTVQASRPPIPASESAASTIVPLVSIAPDTADADAARILAARFAPQSEPDAEAERILFSVYGRRAERAAEPAGGSSTGIAAADALVARPRRAATGGARREAEDPEARRILASVFGG